jgi:hypothetical protein
MIPMAELGIVTSISKLSALDTSVLVEMLLL